MRAGSDNQTLYPSQSFSPVPLLYFAAVPHAPDSALPLLSSPWVQPSNSITPHTAHFPEVGGGG